MVTGTKTFGSSAFSLTIPDITGQNEITCG